MKNKRRKAMNTSNIIKPPKQYLFLGIGGMVIFLVLALIIFFAREDISFENEPTDRIFTGITMLFFSAVCLFSILFQLIWRIEIGKTECVLRNVFGKKKTYQYKDMRVIELSRCTKFYHKKKCIASFNGHKDAVILKNAIQNNSKYKGNRR